MINVLSYSGSNVTTSAYTLLFQTSIPASKIEITDSSGKVLKLATGLSGAQVDFCSVPISGTIVLPVSLASGTYIWIRAIDATAATGYNVISILP